MRVITLMLMLFLSCRMTGQVFPSGNIKLNYTQIMFDHPEVKKAVVYLVKVSEFSSGQSFDKSLVFSIYDSTSSTRVNGLKFGKKYRWKYSAFNKAGKMIFASEEFSFETLKWNLSEKPLFRYNIRTKKVDDGIIFLDDSKTAIDRSGNPVWFFPDDVTSTQDLKMSPSGSLTFIALNGPWGEGRESDLNGNILWETPSAQHTLSGDLNEHFHHCFYKLKTGNYLIMGNKYVIPKRKINANRICFGTIIEYDADKKMVWKWDAETFLPDTDVYFLSNTELNFTDYYKNYDKIFDPVHLNGFYLDETNDILYISLRNMSRVVKFDRKTGRTLVSFGDKYPSGEAKYGNGYFKFLHAPVLLPTGDIMVFNNNNIENSPKPRKTASTVIFTQPVAGHESSDIKWELKCDFDTLSESFSLRTGNAIFMKDSDILINMGEPVNRVFEVDWNKKLKWDCISEKYSVVNNSWSPSYNAKVSYAKSLYPFYFSLTTSFNPDTVKFAKNMSYKFRINNEGTSDDGYNVKYFYRDDEVTSVENITSITPGKSRTVELNLGKEKVQGKMIRVIVTSVSNPRMKKEFDFYAE